MTDSATHPTTTTWIGASDTSADGTRCEPPGQSCFGQSWSWSDQSWADSLGMSSCPRGNINDFTQSIAAVSLYCWIAPAGSTCLGQTRVHSPTEVHPHMPSG